MSLRAVVLVVLLGCCEQQHDDRPERAADGEGEAAARGEGEAGELDAATAKADAWRYPGDRKDCFFVVGRQLLQDARSRVHGGVLAVGEGVQRSRGGGPELQVSVSGSQLTAVYAAFGATTFGIRTRGPTRNTSFLTLR